jgi:Domain of unknown function (DUF222)/HNH endonuclease
MSGILSIESARGAVTAATVSLTDLAQSIFAVGNTELGPFFRELDDLGRQVEAARVGLLAEALGRGVVAQSECPSVTGWVIQWAPSLRGGGAGRLVTVAQATRVVRNAALAAAVLGARVGVVNASVVLAEMDKLRPRIRDEALDAVLDGFVAIATEHGPREIRGLRDALIATYGKEEEFQDRHDRLKHGVSLSQPLDDDGMAVYRLRLDPEGSQVLEAMLGPLSAPRPTPACSDLRSSDQRRGDALVEICRRAAAAGGGAPATTKAQLFVTIDLTDLQTRTRTGTGAGTRSGTGTGTWAGTGTGTGTGTRAGTWARAGAWAPTGTKTRAGTTMTGQLLAPETIRRIACDATIIPVVLGTDSEVLDLGRAKRLFTPGILHAMWLRDKGCTIPGCGAPPFWADAHHIVHWADGGPTALTNAALLCGRHHTIAHQRGWTATATTSEVTWHL